MLLDTFTLLFEADAKNLEDGLKDSNKQADRLTDELKKSDSAAQGATNSIGAAFKSLAGLAAGFIAIGSLKTSFSETVETLNDIGRTAESLNVAVEDVDAFSRSIVAMGGDAGGARDALVDMAESIGEAVQDVESGRAKVYASLGISLKDINGQSITATEGLLRLSDAVSGLSKEEAIFRIKELGITDNRTVELILKGRKEMERMLAVQKEQSGVTKEAVENARKYNEALGRLNNATDAVTISIASTFIPALTKAIEWLAKMVEWARENSEVVKAFFITIGTVITAFFLPAIAKAVAGLGFLFSPVTLAVGAIVALAAAFALLYDDVMNFLEGNDSVIGEISKKYPAVGETVKALAGVIKEAWAGLKTFILELWEAIKPLAESIGGVFKSIGNSAGILLDILGGVVKKIGNLLGVDLSDAFNSLGGVVSSVMNGIVEVVKWAVGILTGAFDLIGKGIAGVGNAASWVGSKLGLIEEERPAPEIDPLTGRKSNGSPPPNPYGSVVAGQEAIKKANASPMNSVTSGAISNSVTNTSRATNVHVGEVTVNTQATDAGGISRDIGGSLRSELQNMDNEFSTGVER